MAFRHAERRDHDDRRPRRSAGWRAADERAGATEGITAIALATGDAGRAKVLVKAKGPQFDAQPLPPAQSPSPLVTQLFNSSTPACWGAAFSAPPIRQRGARWKDKND